MKAETPDDLWAMVIERSWRDADFKQRLKTDPKAVLNELGFALPDGLEVEVVENSATKIYMTLPGPVGAPEPDIDEIESTATGPGRSACSITGSCCCCNATQIPPNQ